MLGSFESTRMVYCPEHEWTYYFYLLTYVFDLEILVGIFKVVANLDFA